MRTTVAIISVGDRKGTTKKLCDKDFAERSGELSGVISSNQKGRKGAGVKGAGVANCRISVVVWSILLVSLSGVKKKL